MFDAKSIVKALIEGDEGKLADLVRESLNSGVPAKQILNEGLMSGMDVIGERMENEEMFIPEVLKSARAMSNVVKILSPLLAEGEVKVAGKVVIGTVKGDLHDIGKNLVAMMLESAGFEVYNLGVDVTPDRFISEVKAKEANLLCLSALLTTTMPMMKRTVEAVAASGLRDRVSILVGGAPVTQSFADDIGADGYAPDAGSAVRAAKAIAR